MKLLVVGTLAFDSVETPFGKRDKALGGSANFIAVAASFFCDVCMVGVIGEDFPDAYLEAYRARGIDTAGIERLPGKTFAWKGHYHTDINDRDTLDTQLNVVADWKPKVPESFRDAEYVALGNIDPSLQVAVLDQLTNPKLVMADTMNFWIERTHDALLGALKRIDLLSINDSEARQLSGLYNLVDAAARIRELGPRALIIKRGEHGATVFSEDNVFVAPAFPIPTIKDPTGAGDSFAGGLIGYLTNQDGQDQATMRQATIMGSTLASFVCEDFSSDRFSGLDRAEIRERFEAFKKLTEFEIPRDGLWER